LAEEIVEAADPGQALEVTVEVVEPPTCAGSLSASGSTEDNAARSSNGGATSGAGNECASDEALARLLQAQLEEEGTRSRGVGGKIKWTKKLLKVKLTPQPGGSLGIAIDGNNRITAVYPDGAVAVEGTTEVGDVVTEVNGKDLKLTSFGHALPKDKAAPIHLRLLRFVPAASNRRVSRAPETERLVGRLVRCAPDAIEAAPTAKRPKRKSLESQAAAAERPQFGTLAGPPSTVVPPLAAAAAALTMAPPLITADARAAEAAQRRADEAKAIAVAAAVAAEEAAKAARKALELSRFKKAEAQEAEARAAEAWATAGVTIAQAHIEELVD